MAIEIYVTVASQSDGPAALSTQTLSQHTNYLTPQFYPCQHIRYILSVSFSDSLSCDDSISKINKNIFLGRSKTFPNI